MKPQKPYKINDKDFWNFIGDASLAEFLQTAFEIAVDSKIIQYYNYNGVYNKPIGSVDQNFVSSCWLDYDGNFDTNYKLDSNIQNELIAKIRKSLENIDTINLLYGNFSVRPNEELGNSEINLDNYYTNIQFLYI